MPNPESAEAGAVPVTALIPVEGSARGALEATLRSLWEGRANEEVEVCLAAGPGLSPGLREALPSLPGRPGATRIVDSGADFAATLRELCARDPGRDVVLLAPGVVLPFAWDARLQKAAHAQPRIGAAVPLCDAAPCQALVDEKHRAGEIPDPALVDRSAYCLGDRSYYEIPVIDRACAWLRGDALGLVLPTLGVPCPDAQSLLDALARRLRSSGWSCVVCDYLYVGTPGLPAATRQGEASLEEAAYLRDHPLGALRHAVNEAIRAGLQAASVPGLDHRPVHLHIMHFWGGGLERWVRDYGRADTSRTHMILATFRIGETGGQRLVLYSDPAAMLPIRVWDIARPIRSTAPASIEYRRILAQILEEFDVEAIVVSSLIGHALDALDQPRKTVVVCHDFYPICQAINPRFRGTCERCTLEDLRECASSNPLNRIFTDTTSGEWDEMRRLYVERLLANRVEMVVPSPWVAATMRQLEPRLGSVPIHVIGHGIDLTAPKVPAPPAPESGRLRIVVLGRLSLHKGMGLLKDASEGLRAHAEITLLGCGKDGVRLAAECGWSSVERYSLDELPGLLASISPHAGLLASVVPETFSYTLSELFALGIPPLATAMGSFRERIADGESGFLFEPRGEALVALVRRLAADPGALAKVAGNLAARPRGRTAADMASDYQALLPAGRRAIARFRVGVGRQSGLTEPYRHLRQAYAELTEAYEQRTRAYEHARSAYDRTKGALDETNANLRRWAAALDEIAVETHWWRTPQALRLASELGKSIRSAGQEGTHGEPDDD